MKALIIAIVLGAVGYFVFFYHSPDQNTRTRAEKIDIPEEYDTGMKTYNGAFMETYNTYKKGVTDTKNIVNLIEKKYQ